jgi:hypothetical protein
MNPLLIIPHYLSWHYTDGILGFYSVFKNFLWFLWNFFSIEALTKTLFSSFLKNRGFRMIGFLIRITVILLGLIFISLFIILGIICFITWLVLPFLIFAILAISLWALFNFQEI